MSALWADTPLRGRVLAAVLLAAFLAAPLIADRYLISVLILVLYFAYVGQAWNLLMGFAGQLSLGHALYLGIGAYVAAALWIHFGVGPWLGVFAAIPVAALGGAFIGWLGWRFSIEGVYFALLTIAFAEFTRIGFDHWDFTGASAGFFLPIGGEAAAQWWNLGGGPLLFYYVALALATGATGLIAGLRRSALGYRWLAVREDAEAARALGINIFRARMAAMLISSSMTAVAGVFYAFYYRNLFPAQVFDIGRSIELILAPIIGGLGTVFGPIVGALILTPLGEALIAAERRVAVARRRARDPEPRPMTPLLAIEGVSKRFRGLRAVDRVSCEILPGQIFAVIGPNGAGKTTLFSMVAGVLRPDEGTITFAGERIDGRRPDEIARRGIGRTFQNVRPFPALSVEDNVVIGALLHAKDMEQALERAHQVIWQLDLFAKLRQPAAALALPDRKRLELARSLATRPKLLLLDEVMAGLRPTETDQMVAILRELNRTTGVTILLIEHVMRAVMALASRVLVLHHGAAIADGTPEEVVRDPAVIQSYLGAEAL